MACTAVAVTIMCIAAACGGGRNIMSGVSSVMAHALNRTHGHSALIPQKGNGAFLAAFFQTTTPPPSQLAESYEGTCDVTGALPSFTVQWIPAAECSQWDIVRHSGTLCRMLW